MNRGNRKAPIFEDDRDRKRFLRILIETAAEYQVRVLVGVQMGNHFHLTVLTPHGNLSEFMQQLEGRFAQYSNWRYTRVGHLFQGRFTGVIIENDVHLFTAFWYIVTNPTEACLVSRPEDWKWSTYAATVGLGPVPQYLSIEWVEALFPAGSLEESQKLLRECMNDPQPVQAFLRAVEPTTAASVRSYIAERLRELPQPCSYRTLMRPPIEQLFLDGQDKGERTNAVALAHETHGYKLAEIARGTGLTYSNVSRMYRNFVRNRGQTPN